MKKNKISKLIVIFIVFMLFMGVVQITYAAYSKINTDKVDNTEQDTKKIKKIEIDNIQDIHEDMENPVPLGEIVKVKKISKKQIDVSSVSISKEIESDIKKFTTNDSMNNINNYKTLVRKFDVPNDYRLEIQSLIKNGNDPADIFIAYEFLYDSYGQKNELNNLLNKKALGKSWAEIFKEYNEVHSEFVPRKFKTGYLENLMKDTNITIDDIMNADRISQKEIKDFEELIEMRKQGKTWKEINTELGIINTSEKLPRVSISGADVERYAKEKTLTEGQVKQGLIFASKLDSEAEEILKKIEAGQSKEEIFADYYNQKYR